MQINKDHKSKLGLINIDHYRVLPNRLTSVYSKNYYKEENYLKVKTVVFKYITPPHSNGLVCWYITLIKYVAFSCTEFSACTKLSYITQLPLILQLYWFHQSCVLRTNFNPIQVLFQYLYRPIYKIYNTHSLLFSFILEDCSNL